MGKEATGPAVVTPWKEPTCKTASVNYSDAGALPDFEEILTTCPTTADATAIWSKMGWSHFTSGTRHWTRVSGPRVGAEVVPTLVEVEVAVPRLTPAIW